MERNDRNLFVNYGEEDQMEIYPYRINKLKLYVTYFGHFITCGITRLVLYWIPHLLLWSTHSKCSLEKAEKILLVDKFHSYHVVKVETITKEGTGVKIRRPKKELLKTQEFSLKPEKDNSLIRYFVCKRVKYIWDSDRSSYIPLKGLDEGSRQSFFHTTQGLTPLEQTKRRVLYGSNSIAVHVTPVMKLLFREFERALRNTITSNNINTVLRCDGTYEDIPSDELVPGDIIEIPRHGCDMLCDAVLIAGNCIVNESMLTGESVPVTKTPLPNTAGLKEENDPEVTIKTHSRHILFCGTHVIQTRFYGNQKVKAVVLRTGKGVEEDGRRRLNCTRNIAYDLYMLGPWVYP
ncbi:hypothetical protein Btru_025981 [Bulinus truncatus]|nr:hypothetical protein Btru_025981 [Bulinus truncatus]